MSILRHYAFRNFIKEKICQIHDTIEYSTNHPYTKLKKAALDSTMDFIMKNCPRAIGCRTPKGLMDVALSKVFIDGQYLECGVFKGDSIRYIAKKNPDKIIHGFDSFEGLQEPWVHYAEGAFSTQGNLPKVPQNVKIWKGYFDKTIPEWNEKHNGSIAFIHIDCDLRSSTEIIFKELSDKFVSGTVMLFDDYFNFPYWENDGHAVLTMFLKKSSFSAEYLGYAFKELAIIIR